jgi:hypothetical protein
MDNDFLDRQMKAARKTPIKTNNLDEDDSFRSRVAHVLRGRSLKEFVAEIGLGPQQSLTMTPEEITNFVALAEARQHDDPYSVGAWQRTTKMPNHFTLED